MYDFIPLHIIVEEFCPLFFTEFLQFIEIYWHSYMHSFLKVPPEHFNQVEVCALARHGSDSFLFQSFCCRFVTVLEINVLLNDPISIKVCLLLPGQNFCFHRGAHVR